MIEILVLDTTVLYAIIIFVVCVIIGFFGDMYMRKNNKMGNIFDFRKKDKGITNDVDQKEEKTNTDVDIPNDNINTINQNSINGAISDVGQNNLNNNVISNDDFLNQSINSVNNNTINEVSLANNSMSNIHQNGVEATTNNDQNKVGNTVINNNDLLDQGINSIINEASLNNDNIVNNNVVENNNLFGSNDFVNVSDPVFNDNKEMVSRPVPFDGNAQNDDQINNMF